MKTRRFSNIPVAVFTFALLGCSMTLVGCGSSSEEVAQSPPQPAQTTVASNPVSVTKTVDPEARKSAAAVVSQFLDLVRRGGDTNAGNLLTQTAQSELKRIGRSVQPIGSQDATFRVTRAEPVEGEQNAMLVQSIWTEPNTDGTNSEFEVVWAVHLEQSGWRISGLAMEIEPGVPPTVIDFENGDLMAKFLAEPSSEQSQQATQAAAPSAELVR